MERTYNLNGLETFSIGVILLAGTSFLVYLDIGLILAFVYRLINALALCVMAVGIFSLSNYNTDFPRAKMLIVLDIIVTIGAAGLIPFGYYGQYPVVDYLSLFFSIAAIMLGIGTIYLVIRGCGKIAEDKGDADHGRSCRKTGKIFLVLSVFGFVALSAMVALENTMAGVSLFIIIFAGILIVGGHVIMMIRAHETAKRFHETQKA